MINEYMERFIRSISKFSPKDYKIVFNNPRFVENLNYVFRQKISENLPDIYNKIASNKNAKEAMLHISYNWLLLLNLSYKTNTFKRVMNDVCRIGSCLCNIEIGKYEALKYSNSRTYTGKSVLCSKLYDPSAIAPGEYFSRKIFDKRLSVQYYFSYFVFYFIVMHWIDSFNLNETKKALSEAGLSMSDCDEIFCTN